MHVLGTQLLGREIPLTHSTVFWLNLGELAPQAFLQAQFLLEEDVYDKRKLKWHLYVDKG